MNEISVIEKSENRVIGRKGQPINTLLETNPNDIDDSADETKYQFININKPDNQKEASFLELSIP